MNRVLLLLLAVSSFSNAFPGLPKDDGACVICKASCEGLEKTEGEDITNNEKQIEQNCFDFCDSILGDEISKLICDDFLKSELKQIETYLEDPTQEDKSAEAICEFLGKCTKTRKN